MCLCLGPVKSGKTFLMKRLQGDEIDNATHTVPTNGINLFTIKNTTGEFDMIIKEIGGSMAPIWKHYFKKVNFFSESLNDKNKLRDFTYVHVSYNFLNYYLRF